MLDSIVTAIQTFFLETVGEELCVFFCSMIPIIELRGAIPLGAAIGLPWWLSYFLSVVGNMLPVPIILLFVKAVITWMGKSKVKFFNKVADFLNKRVEKRRGQIEKYSFWGVCFFVAVPLPVTGAWTGSLVAAMIDMKFWKALLSCLLGVMIAGVIMTVISYGALAVFFS
ncbi:MAG: small multi-drug export protein [Ruminococcaceae bacterium]|nr:small multi-drug export protein [Oscillospiraceae bacterium]